MAKFVVRWERAVVVLTLLAGSSACGPSLDVTTALAVTDVTTGWLDVGLDDLGQNKLVPTMSFRLANASEDTVRTLQLNGVFRRCEVIYDGQTPTDDTVSPADPDAGTCQGEAREWGSSLIRAVGHEGIEPGNAIGPFTLENKLGYTGEQSRNEILQHRDFVDVKVELFVKHRADRWAKLGEFQVERQLLTQ